MKTDRAREHLDSLKTEIEVFKTSKSHRIARERDVKNQRYILRIRIADVPDRIPLIAGDFINCLRSSLDHLVWSLAKLTKPYPRGTQFPILEVKNEKTFDQATKGVPTEARRIIESLQPFRVGQRLLKSHLLWRLNKLCNIDKHRRIPTHGDVSEILFPDLSREDMHLVEHDDKSMTVSVPLYLESKMRVEPDASYNLFFGDLSEGIKCDVAGLEDMYKYVSERVIPQFARFFR